jgi:hypothetical protein
VAEGFEVGRSGRSSSCGFPSLQFSDVFLWAVELVRQLLATQAVVISENNSSACRGSRCDCDFRVDGPRLCTLPSEEILVFAKSFLKRFLQWLRFVSGMVVVGHQPAKSRHAHTSAQRESFAAQCLEIVDTLLNSPVTRLDDLGQNVTPSIDSPVTSRKPKSDDPSCTSADNEIKEVLNVDQITQFLLELPQDLELHNASYAATV